MIADHHGVASIAGGGLAFRRRIPRATSGADRERACREATLTVGEDVVLGSILEGGSRGGGASPAADTWEA